MVVITPEGWVIERFIVLDGELSKLDIDVDKDGDIIILDGVLKDELLGLDIPTRFSYIIFIFSVNCCLSSVLYIILIIIYTITKIIKYFNLSIIN